MNPPHSSTVPPSPDKTPEDRAASDAITAEGASVASRELRYVDLAPPQPGKVVTVAPGVQWCRIPLPIDLDHINVWLVETDGGSVLVDTGMAVSVCMDAWEDVEREVFAVRPLRAIFITHIHPDHMGLVTWLQQRHNVPVWMSQRTYDQALWILGGQAVATPGEAETFFKANGVAETASLQPYFTTDRLAKMMSGMPQVERTVADGETLGWAGRSWRAMETNGHADGHLCLFDAAGDVLISGDQVLPTISSNISLTWRNRDKNPLDSFLSSLRRLRQLPDETLVLPSHGRPFRGLRHRIDDLLNHHEEQLSAIVQACAQAKTAAELLPFMYRRVLKGMHLLLALAEALAHLEYLVAGNRLERGVDAQGVIRYRAC